MLPEEREGPAEVAPMRPRWRAALETRWQERVREVTELSVAYHDAAAPEHAGPGGGRRAEMLLRRTVAARRKLADIEEALTRLAAGEFGSCEECGSAIPAGLLAVIPESRYCPRCDAPPAGAHGSTGAHGPDRVYGPDGAYGVDKVHRVGGAHGPGRDYGAGGGYEAGRGYEADAAAQLSPR
jgi:DnaK suppressor protein